MKKDNPPHSNKHTLDFAGATVIVWPELDRVAVVSPFESSSVSFDEFFEAIRRAKKMQKERP